MAKRRGALDGLKILDFTTLLPGPYATMMLADLGAEVVKISSRGRYDLVVHWPPVIRGTDTTASCAWLGRNKKTVFLNLKKRESVEAVKELVKEYDIVIEQFRPGVMDRLGIGYEALREVNPRVIYCAVTGYGQTGPMALRAGHDCNYMARSGILSAAGRRDGGPSLYNFQIADVAAGSNLAVIGILAAVYHREKTGEGQFVDISMCDGTVPFNSMDGASFLAGADEPERESGMLNGGGIYDFYETSDGKYMSVGALEPQFFAALCKGLGFPEWADGKELREGPASVRHIKEAFKARFKTKTRDEWTDLFRDLDACVEPVLTLEEASRDPQLQARGMWPEVPLPETKETGAGEIVAKETEVEEVAVEETGVRPPSPQDAKTPTLSQEQRRQGSDPCLPCLPNRQTQTVRQMGCPVHLSLTPPVYRHAGYPEGWHTVEFLREKGYTDEQIENMSN